MFADLGRGGHRRKVVVLDTSRLDWRDGHDRGLAPAMVGPAPTETWRPARTLPVTHKSPSNSSRHRATRQESPGSTSGQRRTLIAPTRSRPPSLRTGNAVADARMPAHPHEPCRPNGALAERQFATAGGNTGPHEEMA